MCGIAGIFGNIDKEQMILRMISSLNRRGPDDNGYWINDKNKIAIGQTRLSIIDTSEKGHQPMRSSSRRYSIVFNGEIFNYKEIKEKEKPLPF